MKLALLPCICVLGLGQPAPVRVTPDCVQNFAFNAAGQTSVYNNFSNGIQCNTWTLSYSSTTFTVVSIIVETAPDAGGTPSASWSTFSATGNPASSITSTAVQLGSTTSYFPWIRVRLATGTAGTPPPANLITGILQGWRISATPGSPGGGTLTADVNIVQVDGAAVPSAGLAGVLPVAGTAAAGAAPNSDPNYIAGRDGAGNLLAPVFCTLNAAISLTTSGLTQLIALSGSTQIRICEISVAFASAVDFQLEYGTGSACGTGTTALTGVYKGIGTIALDFPEAPLIVPVGQALCANLGTSVTGGGVINYARY